jgi:hypothetical protein
MRAGETLVASDGYEVALFPCEALYLSPAREPDEHDVLALDFLPRNTQGGTITAMKCYAPFSGTLVYTGNDHNCILESDDKVHAPDGSLKYMRVLVAHSEVAPVRGTHYNQGDQFYTTGNYGYSFGEHLHMEVATVDSKSAQYWNSTYVGIYGAIHMWNALYVNDTVLLRPESYNWQTYGGPTPPPPIPPHPFGKANFVVMFNNISRTKRKEVNLWRT